MRNPLRHPSESELLLAADGELSTAEARQIEHHFKACWIPADFLIAPSGRISAVKYGTDAYDQWSVDGLTLAKGVAAKAL